MGFSGLGNRDYCRRKFALLTTWHPLSAKVGANFADKLWLLGRYSSLVDKSHRVVLMGFPGGSGIVIRHNTQNNTPRSNKTQHTNNKGHIAMNTTQKKV
jgi:hypothetical protein